MKVRAVIYCTRKELYRLLKGKPQEYIDGDVNTICKNINNALLAKEDKFSFYADIFKEDNINYSERVKNLKPLSSLRGRVFCPSKSRTYSCTTSAPSYFPVLVSVTLAVSFPCPCRFLDDTFTSL